MRRLFIATFLVAVIVTIASLAILPDRVAMNFGANGMPNSWASKYVYAAVSLTMLVMVFGLCLAAPVLVMILPSGYINLRHKEYWLQDANKPRARTILVSLMSEFGFALVLFMLCVGLLVVKAHTADPVRLDAAPFFALLIGFTVYVVYWCVKLCRSFKVTVK